MKEKNETEDVPPAISSSSYAKKLSLYPRGVGYTNQDTIQPIFFLKQLIILPQDVTNRLIPDENSAPAPGITPRRRARRSVVMPRFNRGVAMVDTGITRYGRTSKVRNVSRDQRRHEKASSEEEQEQLRAQQKLMATHLMSDVTISAAKNKLNKIEKKRRPSRSSSRFRQVSPNVKSIRLTGAALGVLSAGFDLYHAVSAFRALSTTTDPKTRQDLIVKGSLYTAATSVGIGMAYVGALGGTAAAVGGPIAVALVVGIYATAEIYTMVRAIEEVERYVKNLTWVEKLKIAWLTFSGQMLSPDIENPLAAAHTKLELERARDSELERQMTALLLSDRFIDSLYFSRPNVTMIDRNFQQLFGKDHRGYERLVRDNIPPSEHLELEELQRSLTYEDYAGSSPDPYEVRRYTTYVASRHGAIKVTKAIYRYQSLRTAPNSYKAYSQGNFQEIDDTIDSHGRLSAGVIKRQFIGTHELVGKLVDPQGKSLTTRLNMIYNDNHAMMGDFNGDGHRDIGYFSPQGFYWLRAMGKGDYAAAERVKNVEALHAPTVRTLVADINKDNLDDIVIIGNSRDPIRILLAEPNGTFTDKPFTLTPGAFSRDAILIDIDKDGRADLVTFTINNINICYGNAHRTFDAPISFSVPASKRPPTNQSTYRLAGDINGDGCGDVVWFTEDGSMSILLGNPNRKTPFTVLKTKKSAAIEKLNGDFDTAQIQLYDMNGDGRADFVVIQDDGSYTVAYGKKNGEFSREKRDAVGEEDGKTVRYRPNILAVRRQQHILGISTGTDGYKALLSLNQQGEVNAHSFQATPITERKALYKLGGANDTLTGEQDKKNDFEVAAGRKQLTGGPLSDRFLLMGAAVPDTPSILKGGMDDSALDNADTVIAVAKPSAIYKGYYIDLTQGFVKYRYKDSSSTEPIHVANLQHIENAVGHRETDDILIGNDLANILDGVGGNDRIFAKGGNDIIRLQAGEAHGGQGVDIYHILQHNSQRHLSITLVETANQQENSSIILDYKAEQIIAINQVGGDVLLTLRSDSGSSTTLTLRDIYSAPQDNKRTLQHDYQLHTRDGFLIGWPPTVAARRNMGPFATILAAQYNPINDRSWKMRTQGLETESISVRLQSRNQQGQGQITISDRHGLIKSTAVLPRFMQLVMEVPLFNDIREGESGDDTYWYATGDGHDSIIEKGGNDRLTFISEEITKEKLWLKKENNDLIVLVNGSDSGDSLTIKDYYALSQRSGVESKIEKIEAGKYQLVGNNIDRMVMAMAAFSTSADELNMGARLDEIQQQINTLWVESTMRLTA
ncbi:FG-GAP-like repeat-containing protein [Candidatus Regiella endosymbiont of Tuberolachnus salignus]|uniref:FG-GAP-like repeat-containing protein n=1 Tax=Candidatus Regiella endosymbiont of Tuberolachnus salignus TaxID=3077956 RepID=UPI0030CFA85F